MIDNLLMWTMERSYNYLGNENHHQFLDAIDTMYTIHKDTATLEHGIKTIGQEKFRRFTPTSFVYAFFEFNVLYNYKWEESLNTNSLIFYDDDAEPYKDNEWTPEKEKIGKFIRFCFSNTSFVKQYRSSFLTILLHRYNEDEIIEAIHTITPDQFISENDKEEFTNACINLLDDERSGDFQKNLRICIFFIYKIRCKVFHGKKTIRDIEDDVNQRIKLTIYFYFIIALCQMFFSNLDYCKIPYNHGKTCKSYDILCEELGIE